MGLSPRKATFLGNKDFFMSPTPANLVKIKTEQGEGRPPPFYGPIHVTEPGWIPVGGAVRRGKSLWHFYQRTNAPNYRNHHRQRCAHTDCLRARNRTAARAENCADYHGDRTVRHTSRGVGGEWQPLYRQQAARVTSLTWQLPMVVRDT